VEEDEMTARDQSLEDALLAVADGSTMSNDPEWKYVPVRRFAAVADDTQDDYGGPDTFGAEDILL
jgi:hypothetical protein